MRVSLGLALGCTMLGGAARVAAQQPSAQCREAVVRGSVTAGQSYEARLSPSLVFRLQADTVAANPPGWTIRVTPPADPDTDYSMVATPPYRWANPRYVDTGYGIAAEQALTDTPRAFAFVGGPDDYERARAALDVLLWPYTFTDAQVDSTRALMDALRTYPASFHIEDGEASVPTTANPQGRIERMAFRLEVCVPT